MNTAWIVVAIVALIALGIVADYHERRAERRIAELNRQHEQRRLMHEIRRHDQ